jgi:hypothetical protein
VQVRIFLFDEAMVAEFKVQNNMPNSVLENLKIDLKHSGESFEVLHIIPAKIIRPGEVGECFVGLKKN